jgi:regulator of replication initiation timing
LGANYGRGLFKQPQDTIEQAEKLTTETREIKPARQMETAGLKTGIANLRAENAALKAENQKLKAAVNKDSGNPSKPPPSDGFKKIYNSREKTGGRTGNQSQRNRAPALYGRLPAAQRNGKKRHAAERHNHTRRGGKSVCRHALQRRAGFNKPDKGGAF